MAINSAGQYYPDFRSIANYSNASNALDNYDIAPNFNVDGGDAITANIPSMEAIAGGGGWFDGLKNIFGGEGGTPSWLNKDTMSTLGGLAQGAGSLWNAYNASKQFKLAQDQFDFTKGAFNANFANQAKNINAQLEDRQRARIGGTGDNNAAGNYQSLEAYMDQNKVNGAPVA